MNNLKIKFLSDYQTYVYFVSSLERHVQFRASLNLDWREWPTYCVIPAGEWKASIITYNTEVCLYLEDLGIYICINTMDKYGDGNLKREVFLHNSRGERMIPHGSEFTLRQLECLIMDGTYNQSYNSSVIQDYLETGRRVYIYNNPRHNPSRSRPMTDFRERVERNGRYSLHMVHQRRISRGLTVRGFVPTVYFGRTKILSQFVIGSSGTKYAEALEIGKGMLNGAIERNQTTLQDSEASVR